jgi:hypothetical protein
VHCQHEDRGTNGTWRHLLEAVKIRDALVEECLGRLQILVREPELRNPHCHVRVSGIYLTHVGGHAFKVAVLQTMLVC